MTSTSVSANPSLTAPAGAAVVPGTSAIGTPAAPATGIIGGGATPPADPAQLIALLTTLLTLLRSMPGAQGAQVGAASVQGGGGAAAPVQPGVSGFGPTTMGGFVALGATQSDGFGSAMGSTVGGALLGGTLGTSTSLSNGSVPGYLPSIGSVIGGGGSFGTPAPDPNFGTTTFGGFSAISPTPAPTPSTFGTAPTGATTVGGVALGTVAGATGGGAAAAPAATPQIDMRRVLGTPRAGDVIDTILKRATLSAAASHSEGQYIVLQDASGAQLQAHVHGAWSSNPTRILEGIQRGFVQVHLHEDGTLHLHDVV
ncbi:MAG: hypothetical protein JWL76_1579 [Thermoleophilia bacterium]|nr:hypothetical protein [Thermoleophilia bacterium]